MHNISVYLNIKQFFSIDIYLISNANMNFTSINIQIFQYNRYINEKISKSCDVVSSLDIAKSFNKKSY